MYMFHQFITSLCCHVVCFPFHFDIFLLLLLLFVFVCLFVLGLFVLFFALAERFILMIFIKYLILKSVLLCYHVNQNRWNGKLLTFLIIWCSK
jgi:hypothetical protein